MLKKPKSVGLSYLLSPSIHAWMGILATFHHSDLNLENVNLNVKARPIMLQHDYESYMEGVDPHD